MCQEWQGCFTNMVGEMVRAMSAQKRNLACRLKAAESSNRQLRAELQELKAGWRWGQNPNPIAHQASSSASRPATGVSGEALAMCSFSLVKIGLSSQHGRNPMAAAVARHALRLPHNVHAYCTDAIHASEVSSTERVLTPKTLMACLRHVSTSRLAACIAGQGKQGALCSGKDSMCAGSWQEMAAVLDMLQDINIPSENSQLDRSLISTSPAVSPQRKPRCISAVAPASQLRAVSRKPRCSSALSPGSPEHAASRKDGVMPMQQLSPLASSRSGTPSKGKLRASPLSVGAAMSHRQDWQT